MKGYNKGIKTISMLLDRLGHHMNHKKIRRIMRKFRLFCPIRKPNPYKSMLKNMQTNYVADNLVKREFKDHGPRTILLTDITYIFYKNHERAYLSTIKDAYTNEILAYKLSDNMELPFVLDTVKMLIKNHGKELNPDTTLHSDQGAHYTSKEYQKLLKSKKINQSMSRRGNCWDNAPQESFFGHMKDEVKFDELPTIIAVKKAVKDYMNYYNNFRPQWGLAKLTPAEYYKYSITGEYPNFTINDKKTI